MPVKPLDAAERMNHPGWTQNLIAAGRLQEGERVLVVVDEPLAAEGAELLAAVRTPAETAGSSSGRANRPLHEGAAGRSRRGRDDRPLVLPRREAAARRGRRALLAAADRRRSRRPADLPRLRRRRAAARRAVAAGDRPRAAGARPARPARGRETIPSAAAPGTDLTLRRRGPAVALRRAPARGAARWRTTRAARSSWRRTTTAPTACSSPT